MLHQENKLLHQLCFVATTVFGFAKRRAQNVIKPTNTCFFRMTQAHQHIEKNQSVLKKSKNPAHPVA
jgi:hypothetical protein